MNRVASSPAPTAAIAHEHLTVSPVPRFFFPAAARESKGWLGVAALSALDTNAEKRRHEKAEPVADRTRRSTQ